MHSLVGAAVSPDRRVRTVEDGIVEGADNEMEEFEMKRRQAQTWRRMALLVLAITIHNFPEGLAVGVGFGSIGASSTATFDAVRDIARQLCPGTQLGSAQARSLAIGIGLQNFPEGTLIIQITRRAGTNGDGRAGCESAVAATWIFAVQKLLVGITFSALQQQTAHFVCVLGMAS